MFMWDLAVCISSIFQPDLWMCTTHSERLGKSWEAKLLITSKHKTMGEKTKLNNFYCDQQPKVLKLEQSSSFWNWDMKCRSPFEWHFIETWKVSWLRFDLLDEIYGFAWFRMYVNGKASSWFDKPLDQIVWFSLKYCKQTTFNSSVAFEFGFI